MKKLFIFFLFLITFFLLSNFRVTPSYAIDYKYTQSGQAQECIKTYPNCVMAWGDWVGMYSGHILSQDNVNQIMDLLNTGGFFKTTDCFLWIFCNLSSAAQLIAIQDTQAILTSHIGDPWNEDLLKTLNLEFTAAADYRKDNPLGPLPPLSHVEFSKGLLPCTPDESGNCRSIKTAFGIVPTDASGFVTWVLGFILGLSGGILLLLLILAGYKLMTSQGDPEKIKEAREQVTSAIIGLFFIIFSFVIFEFITHNVLNLPGFGG